MEERLVRIEKAIEALANAQIKTEAQVAKTEAQVAKTEMQVNATSKILSGIGINLGSATEQFFYNTLKDKMALGEIKFDSIHENVKVIKKSQEAEFDIIMYNGDSLAIIESKHNVHQKDIELLATKKVSDFRKFFPKYSKHKIYLGIAGFSFPSNLQELAREKGIAVLKQKGDIASINAQNLKMF